MRWTVHGVPRVPWDAEGVFDGISTFKLDKEGKIYEHSVDNVLLQDPPSSKFPIFAGLNLIPSLQGQQQPCPGKQATAESFSSLNTSPKPCHHVDWGTRARPPPPPPPPARLPIAQPVIFLCSRIE